MTRTRTGRSTLPVLGSPIHRLGGGFFSHEPPFVQAMGSVRHPHSETIGRFMAETAYRKYLNALFSSFVTDRIQHAEPRPNFMAANSVPSQLSHCTCFNQLHRVQCPENGMLTIYLRCLWSQVTRAAQPTAQQAIQGVQEKTVRVLLQQQNGQRRHHEH